MYSTPLAYLLIWSTYGCRLHHDERGSVDRDHNAYGSPQLRPDAFYSKLARDRMPGEPFRLNPWARELVAGAITDHAVVRRWLVKALNPRTEHVHVVVHAPQHPPDTVVSQFKANGTRVLRQRGLAGPKQPVWADRGGSIRYLFTEEALRNACDYVINGQ